MPVVEKKSASAMMPDRDRRDERDAEGADRLTASGVAEPERDEAAAGAEQPHAERGAEDERPRATAVAPLAELRSERRPSADAAAHEHERCEGQHRSEPREPPRHREATERARGRARRRESVVWRAGAGSESGKVPMSGVVAHAPVIGYPGQARTPQSRGGVSGRASSNEAKREVLEAVREVRAQPLRLSCQLDALHAGNELLEQDPELEAREVGAEAEVRAGAPEGGVLVGRPPDVEAVRVGELVRVAVRGGEPDDHLVAGRDRDAADLRVAGRRAPEVPDGMRVAQHLLDRARDELRLAAEQLPLVGVAGEGGKTRGDRLPGRLVPGDDEDRERVVEVAAGERAAVELAVRDQREDIIAWMLSPLPVVLASQPAELLGPGASEGQVAVLFALALERELADVLRLRVDEQPVA